MLSFYLSIVETDEEREKVIFIYENYYSFMCYTAKTYLKNKFDVEDVVHNAMLKIIDNIDIIDLSEPIKAKNLCGIIAKNKAIDFCRNKNNQAASIDDIITQEDEYSNPDNITVSNEVYLIILDTINSMSDVYRDVCLLKYVNELKEREIALLLDLPAKTVSLRIYRGKQLLRTALRKENLHV